MKEIDACLETKQGTYPYLQGAYIILKRWYHNSLVRQPNPSQAYMEKVSKYYAALYQWE